MSSMYLILQTAPGPEVYSVFNRNEYQRQKNGRLSGLVVRVLATDPEARVRFPTLPEKKVVGRERGSLSLVSTTEELLDRKVAAPV
jgi:hypothetical protein